MACNIFTIFALLALIWRSSAGPISSSACVMPTITTGGNKLLGYAQATATPGIANYFPSQDFSNHAMIGGTPYLYSPKVTDRSLVEWGCQYTCGQNCLAFFVFWDTTPGMDPHFECRVYTAPFTKSDLVASPNANWTQGQAFNKVCFGPAMKFKRVAAASIELSTGGSSAALATSAGPFPTSVSTKTVSATSTITITLSSVATHLSTSTSVSTDHSSASASSSSSYTPASITASTTTASTASTCGYSAVAPTATIENVAVDPAFYPGNLISMSYLAAAITSRKDAIQRCAAACDADPKCAAFIVTEGRCSHSTYLERAQAALAVLATHVADVKVVTKPDGTKQWTCDLYQKVLGPGQLIPAPSNKQLGAAFNNMCPVATATA